MDCAHTGAQPLDDAEPAQSPTGAVIEVQQGQISFADTRLGQALQPGPAGTSKALHTSFHYSVPSITVRCTSQRLVHLLAVQVYRLTAFYCFQRQGFGCGSGSYLRWCCNMDPMHVTMQLTSRERLSSQWRSGTSWCWICSSLTTPAPTQQGMRSPLLRTLARATPPVPWRWCIWPCTMHMSASREMLTHTSPRTLLETFPLVLQVRCGAHTWCLPDLDFRRLAPDSSQRGGESGNARTS